MQSITEKLQEYGFTHRQVPYIEKSLRGLAHGNESRLNDLVEFYGSVKRRDVVEQSDLFRLKALCPAAHAALIEVIGAFPEHLYQMVKSREVDFSHVAEAFSRITVTAY